MLYKKPEIKSYSAGDILEEIGPCQNQYSTTLYTTTGNSSVNVDGAVWSDGAFYTNLLQNGDDSSNSYGRGLVGFDISSLQGWTIVSATLRLYQDTVDPAAYTSLGTVVVDHINFGSSVDSGDLTGGTLTSNIGTLSTSATIEWKTLDVSSYVQADINAGRTSSQFRTRFTTNTDSDGVRDLAFFDDSENTGGTGNRPQLVVTYR